MVKLALTMSSFDRIGLEPRLAAGAALEVGPAERGFRVAPSGIALGAVPAAFRDGCPPPPPGPPGMRRPALFGAIALHTVGIALILLVEWSLAAPAALPAIEVSLRFEPVQSAASASRERVAEPAPPDVTAAPPDDAPAPPEPPAASEPPDLPVAVAPPAEVAPPAADPPPVATASPPKPAPAVAKTRPIVPATPRQPQHRVLPSAPSPTETAATAPPAAAAISSGAPAPALLAAVPIVPPRPVGDAGGNRAPVYPVAARSRGLQGAVLLRVDVAPSGTPLAVTIATSSGHQILDDAAVAAVRTWRFSPATQAGVPVAAIADVPIRFSIAN